MPELVNLTIEVIQVGAKNISLLLESVAFSLYCIVLSLECVVFVLGSVLLMLCNFNVIKRFIQCVFLVIFSVLK